MNHDNEPVPEPLPESLRRDLERLQTSPLPPVALEARVLVAARAAGLVTRSPWRTRLTQLAASIALLIVGAAAGRLLVPQSTPTTAAPSLARYMLLLAGDETPTTDNASRAAEYGAWARELSMKGVPVDGEELTGAATLISTRGAALSDLANVGGFFIIEAENDAAAAALAKTCPHVKYGGSVVVRKVVTTEGR